jgi:hypothetical protein
MVKHDVVYTVARRAKHSDAPISSKSKRENLGKYLHVIAFLPLFIALIIPPIASAGDQTVGLFQNTPAAFNGYTLFSRRGTGTYLINNDGQLVHSWKFSGQACYLLENGNLLCREGGCQEIAWDGSIIWEYSYPSSHHDLEPLPNGNVLLITREDKSFAEAVAAGRDPVNIDEKLGLTPLHIIEVKPTGRASGTIVWEWHVWDHLIQDYDPSKPNYGVVADHPELVDLNYAPRGSRTDWLHTNAIDYNPDLDQIIVSPRIFCELWIIDHSTTTAEAAGHTGGNSGKGGDILYRWGNPQAYRAGTESDKKLFGQHDTQWIEPGLPGEGNILIFNNGGTAENWTWGRDGDYSSVDEIVPPVDGYNYSLTPGSAYGPAELIWTYTAETPTDFFAPFISGAQRLANGNTLICSGPQGTFFEVTSKGQTVWKYINPIIRTGPLYQGDPIPPFLRGQDNRVFKCHRYAPDYPGLAGKDLTPGNPLERYKVEFPRWDVNADGVVDISDLVLIGRHFGKTPLDVEIPNADVNGDGSIEISDFMLLGRHFGEDYQ